MKKQLEEILNSLYSDIQEDNVEKNNLFRKINLLGNILWEEFGDIKNENRSKLSKELERQIENENLEVKYNLNNINENPSLGCLDSIKVMQKNFQNFLSIYNIGHVREFELINSNTISIKLASYGLRPIGSYGNEISRRITFEKQLETLEKLNFDLIQNKNFKEVQLSGTTNNLNVLSNLLKKLDAWNIRFNLVSTRESNNNNVAIIETSFYIKPKSLMECQFDSFEIKLEKGDVLNQDEIVDFAKTIREIIGNYNLIHDKEFDGCEELFNNGAIYIMHQYIYLCDIVGLDNEYTNKYKVSKNDYKGLNKEIESTRKEINKYVNHEIIKKTFDTIQSEINKNLYNKCGLCVQEMRVDDNKLTFVLQFNFSKMQVFMYENQNFTKWTSNKVNELFDTNNGDIDIENLYVIGNDRNIQTLRNIISKQYPYTRIDKIEMDSNRDCKCLYISKITIIFLSMRDVLCCNTHN